MNKVVEKVAVLFLCLIRCYGLTEQQIAYYRALARDPTLHEHNFGRYIDENLVQGDIIQKKLDTRQSVNNYQQTWTNNMVPYTFENTYSSQEISFITSTLNQIMSLTKNCIKFVPRTNQKDYVIIKRGDGCYSDVGRKGGEQTLSLGEMCYINGSQWYSGTIMHEVMHTLGFWHEHTRPNRDDYIQVMYDNIQKDHIYDYNKMGADEVLQLEPYDFYSIMHYSMYTFALDTSKTTFEPRDPSIDMSRIGQRTSLSEHDIIRILKLYRCDKLAACPDPVTPRYGTAYKLTNTNIASLSQYSCYPGYTLVGPSSRFCRNDARWSGDNTVCLPEEANANFCDFDVTGTCNWIPQADYWMWIRQTGSTGTAMTGPIFDHTRETSDGFYMYMESSAPAKEGQKFRMRKSGIPYGRYPVCMSFYYSMFGQGIKPGSLRIFVTAAGQDEKMVWKDDGSTINKPNWSRSEISLPMTPFQSSPSMDIIIEAERGSTWTSDIAVDDILIVSCDYLKTYSSQIAPLSTIRLPLTG